MNGQHNGGDLFIDELLIRLPVDEAERILLANWDHLSFSHSYIQIALYISTPSLLKAVKETINRCPEAKKLFKYLSFRFGLKRKSHPGITRESQIHALVPYLHFLDSTDIHDLWNVCNEQGWFSIRREFLDDHLQERGMKYKWDHHQAFFQLDAMVTKDFFYWIDGWIDGFIKTDDVSWAEIYATMMQWLQERRSFEALRIVAAAIEHRGTRKDMGTLMNYEGASETEETLALMLDTEFAVQRRSIH